MFGLGRLVRAAATSWRSMRVNVMADAIGYAGDEALIALIRDAHASSWERIMSDEGLNAGQMYLATMCLDEGHEYLESVNTDTFDVGSYADSLYWAHDAVPQALSQSVEQAVAAVSHVANSTAAGVTRWAGNNFGRGGL